MSGLCRHGPEQPSLDQTPEDRTTRGGGGGGAGGYGAQPPGQDCGRGDPGEGGGQHHQLGQGQGQGEPRVCREVRLRDVQNWRDNVRHSLHPYVHHQVSLQHFGTKLAPNFGLIKIDSLCIGVSAL